MAVDDVAATLKRWSQRASHVIGDVFDICKPLFEAESPSSHPSVFVPRVLFVNCHATSESCLLLVNMSRLWDAEILLRSISEGSAKFLYMCACEQQEKETRVNEFWYILPKIQLLKQHDKATLVIESNENVEDERLRPFRDLLLDTAEMDDIRAAYPRQDRKRIEQKWAFSEIVSRLDGESGLGLGLKSLFHGYSISSHLIHQDASALKIINDRFDREPRSRSLLELAHGARELQDVISLSLMRGLFYFKHRDEDTNSITQYAQAIAPFLEELLAAYRDWHEAEYGTKLS